MKQSCVKFFVRVEKYGSWLLVNYLVCLIPLFITALIEDKINDNIILSYISFSYTTLISGLYIYKNRGDENELVFWSVILMTSFLLIYYILFPNVLSDWQVVYIRHNAIEICLSSLTIIVGISLRLCYKSIEENVAMTFRDRQMKKTKEIENNFTSMLKKLKE